MAAAGVCPDGATVNLLVAACMQGGNSGLAAQLAAELSAQGLLPPPPTDGGTAAAAASKGGGGGGAGGAMAGHTWAPAPSSSSTSDGDSSSHSGSAWGSSRGRGSGGSHVRLAAGRASPGAGGQFDDGPRRYG